MTETNKEEYQEEESILENQYEEASQEESNDSGSDNRQEEIRPEAKRFGHLSKEEWTAQGKNPEEWKSEEEYVEYGRSYTKLKPVLESLKTTITRQNKEIEALVKYQERTAERERTKAQEELSALLYAAKQQGDMDKIEKLTRQQTQLEITQQQEIQRSSITHAAEVDTAFIERNKHWFNINPELTQIAKDINEEYIRLYPNLDYAERVRRVESRMKLDYPDHIQSEHRQAPVISQSRSSVSKSVSGPSEQEDKVFNTLSNEDKHVYAATKRMAEKATGKPYTKQMFINKLRKDGEI